MGHHGLYTANDFEFVQGEDEEADWDLGLLNEEDDGVVHWVCQIDCLLQKYTTVTRGKAAYIPALTPTVKALCMTPACMCPESHGSPSPDLLLA